MALIQKAFRELYPEQFEGKYDFTLAYSGKFKGYNANVKYGKQKYSFFLSKQWRHVHEDIKIGLIQSLLNKVFRTTVQSTNIDLYNLFLKNIHLAVPKDKVDPGLKESFDRVNQKYFTGMMTMPNLVLGDHALARLGSYDFGTDTIRISAALVSDPEALDYVMHHEMLHKKLKFYRNNKKTTYHSGEFKKKEKEFENWEEIEKRLQRLGGGY